MSNDTEITESVKCRNCGVRLPAEWASEPAGANPCPECGSVAKHVDIKIAERVGIIVRETVKGELRNDSLPSNKKRRVKFQTGDEIRRDGKGWVKKDQLLDRDRDLYIEKVVDAESGEVLRDVEEPLSEHRNRGSARIPKE